MKSLLKVPSAWLPIAMSVAAIAVLVIHVSIYGFVRQADEGTAAHIWQLLIGGQVPIVLFFAIKWLPRSPTQALAVLALQALAGLAAMAPIFLTHS